MNKHTFISFLLLGFLLAFVVSCKKEVDLASPPEGKAGGITWMNISEDLLQQVSQAAQYRQYSYVLIDNTDTTYQMGMHELGFPRFFQRSPLFYPVSDWYNVSLDVPWLKYLMIPDGQHQLLLMDTAHHPVLHASVNISVDTPTTVMYVDSFGVYRNIITKDVFNRHSDAVGLRVLHASADAGPVFFTINRSFTNTQGYPDTLKFGDLTSFVQRPVSTASDTLRIRFYSIKDSVNVLAKANLVLEPARAYTIALAGYTKSQSYRNPYSGKTISIGANPRILKFKNN